MLCGQFYRFPQSWCSCSVKSLLRQAEKSLEMMLKHHIHSLTIKKKSFPAGSQVGDGNRRTPCTKRGGEAVERSTRAPRASAPRSPPRHRHPPPASPRASRFASTPGVPCPFFSPVYWNDKCARAGTVSLWCRAPAPCPSPAQDQ